MYKLTQRGGSGDTAESNARERRKNFLKSLKKGVDKRETMWYNNKVARKRGKKLIIEN